MKLSAPKTVVWWIATILGGLGVIGHFVDISFLTANTWWLVAIGFILLFLGTLLKGF
ncbi:hypothetical protein ACFL4L_02125 [bacterium]